jgi:hypothetical protein
MHLWDTIQETPARLRIPAERDSALCRNEKRRLPLPLQTILRPLLRGRLQRVFSWPKYSISGIVAIERGHVWGCFQVRMIWTQIPLIGIDTGPAVTS